MTLVDSTVWIDWFKNRPTKQTALFEKLIREEADICICGIVYAEVLQGIRDDREYARTRALLNGLIFFPLHKETFEKGAVIYRTLRKKGLTIRNAVDCVIAAVCLEHDVRLLHNDRDFIHCAAHFPLKFAL
ncbi:MAG: twitching motility protein PilT [Candidatus Raymondbacteria bacterium RifOxyC12_full_50_8]|uniref:Ribonuclease VapC n=1 Tax=Candidatus Raymondbacteria bacterium RIFOXYD12_FULL_49_13 TaxID=1817890 RepID=A0A1F7F096_UNCRA|nr:MAG: twitching motility protein PilT [Candidatus Raymondbacteria bacterium RIFOXYA2_FULL_49_16]OGK00051.1 MAG: twitching motility protein PilT [Candidatus Raymondbacteria bacterium RIFOXYD12_FULL_49_13]OGK01341.1 MAG: twitching motility protein PilT [Candidatus Raymondbacteria bacterium RifOxyC12_full_50_8]OGK03668.1 MAG: twitching motility protein PilT [Candidatus Raymondbacteria bacterium RifOxyB12_full_50_8]OGP45040.1 MAG: twitching motility protein PilT [Candidatus Raymondbacteria bacter